MPYIKQIHREKWKKIINEVVTIAKDIEIDKLEGELNYLISSILKKIYDPHYFNYNRAIGLLECIKLEMYRVIIGPYEEKKRKENKDI